MNGENVDRYKVWSNGREINHALTILLYKAVLRLTVFYTPMPQFVSAKGFYIEMWPDK